jgi:hypothetical protein
MTMELSTSIPMPSTSPASVIMLRVSPAKYISMRVTMIDTGMLMPIISVGFIERRKRNSMRTASAAPETAVLVTCAMFT